jgi:hypothetical protein
MRRLTSREIARNAAQVRWTRCLERKQRSVAAHAVRYSKKLIASLGAFVRWQKAWNRKEQSRKAAAARYGRTFPGNFPFADTKVRNNFKAFSGLVKFYSRNAKKVYRRFLYQCEVRRIQLTDGTWFHSLYASENIPQGSLVARYGGSRHFAWAAEKYKTDHKISTHWVRNGSASVVFDSSIKDDWSLERYLTEDGGVAGFANSSRAPGKICTIKIFPDYKNHICLFSGHTSVVSNDAANCILVWSAQDDQEKCSAFLEAKKDIIAGDEIRFKISRQLFFWT